MPIEYPDIYKVFMKGKFVAKAQIGNFNGVSPDMKLEQTIQRSKKSAAGIIGQTPQLSYVTERELIFHEVLAISDVYQNMTSAGLSFWEINLHHELGSSLYKLMNESVDKIYRFISERGNPYLTSQYVKLHNLTTGWCVDETDSKKLLEYFEHGEKTCIEFRNERFVDKKKVLSDVIKKVSLPSFEWKSKESTKFKPYEENTKAKIQAIAQKQVDIAKPRFISVPEIVQFDLVPSALFKGHFIAKSEKHLLITELEKHLLSTEYNFAKTSESKTCYSFISVMRRIRLTDLETFKESFEVMWKSILSVCEFNQLNIIYDNYITESIKYG